MIAILQLGIAASARLALAVLALCASAATGPQAQERFAGRWTIAGAVAAPWARNPQGGVDEAEAKRLVGQPMMIAVRSLSAPEPLGCAHATYVFRNTSAEGLFEGALTADASGKPTDAVAAARALGISAKSVRAMTASCSEVEFVLAGPDTIMFGLNDHVFTATRAK
jgi:hypothetical protein